MAYKAAYNGPLSREVIEISTYYIFTERSQFSTIGTFDSAQFKEVSIIYHGAWILKSDQYTQCDQISN